MLASGRVLPIRRRKALALTAFLALSRTPQTREFLASIFWPEADRDSAHALMRTHVWALRAAGLGPWLSVEGEMIELRDAEGLWVDVREHRRLLAHAGLVPGLRGALAPQTESSLSEAVEIYQEPFLAGFHLSDSLAFDEWKMREEEALRTGLGSALDALARLREARGDLEGAVASACRRLDLDPWDERSLRALMTLYLRLGKRNEALLAYERTRKYLERDLELTPARETILLHHRILAGDSQSVLAQPGSAGSPQIILPEPATPFVGREEELLEIARHLEEPGLRLLTLTGPGGCGKTRLALESGRRLSERFPDGVVFVSLASVEAGYLLPAALAEVWSLPLGTSNVPPVPADSGVSGSFKELTDFLREKRILIILDNLEQVASDLGALRAILTKTHRPTFLATSRVRLRIAGEQVFELEGLPWPERTASPERMSETPSVRLFLQAVRRTRSLPTPSPAELHAAARICRRLRGHPLGLELAASWAQSLSVTEIAEQLAANLDLEAAPRTDITPRHRSLRAVFAQSWTLLSPEERIAFRRLSLSPGSFGREAALEIGRTAPDVFTALVEQSILRHTRDRRFEILETLRQFGREKLAANGREESAVQDRAARYYLGRLIDARSSLEGAGQKKTLQDLARDRHHLRSAWLWAAERGWVAEMTRAMRSLFLFYDMGSRVAEGAELFGLTVRSLTHGAGGAKRRAETAQERRLLGLSRVAQGWFIRYQRADRCRRLMQQGQKDLSGTGKREELAFTDALASIVGPPSDHTVLLLRERALQCEKAGDLWCAGFCLEVLAACLSHTDSAEAFRVIHRSLVLRRRCHDQWSVALGIYVLGLALEDRGLLHGARRRYEQSLLQRRRLRVDPDGAFLCSEGIARVALQAGAVEDARRQAEESLILARRTGDQARIGLAQTRLAQAHYLGGTSDEARPPLESALVTAEQMGNAEWSSHLHALSGLVALEEGEDEEARWHLDRSHSDLPAAAGPAAATSLLDDFLRAWPKLWRDLLEARLALSRGDHAGSRRAMECALKQAVALRHEPLILELLTLRVEWCACSHQPSSAVRLSSLLVSGSALPERLQSRVENILRGMRIDIAPVWAVSQKPSVGGAWSDPIPPAPGTALIALATEVLSGELAAV